MLTCITAVITLAFTTLIVILLTTDLWKNRNEHFAVRFMHAALLVGALCMLFVSGWAVGTLVQMMNA